MSGRLIYLMGPSGAGKDSLLRALRPSLSPRWHVARRVVTRAATAPAEEEVRVTPREFDALERASAFSMSWRANGLAYGISRDIDLWLHQGGDVLVNGSRGYLREARRRYPELIAVLLTLPKREMRRRLSERGRESDEEIEARLARSALFDGELTGQVLQLDNSGPLAHTADRLLTFIDGEPQCV